MFLTTDALFFGVGAGPMYKISHDTEVMATFLSRRVSSIEWNMTQTNNEVCCSLSVGPKIPQLILLPHWYNLYYFNLFGLLSFKI